MSVPIGGAAIWVLLHAAGAGAAPARGAIEVERRAGAEDCPGGAALDESIRGILNAPARLAGELEVRASVEFSRGPGGYQATLRFGGAKVGQRTLTDTGASCEALGRAVAITIALVLDAAAESAASAPEVAPPGPSPALVAAPQPVPARRTSAVLSAMAGPAIGVVGPPSVMGGVALGVGVGRRLRLEIAGLGVAPRSAAFDTGAVQVGLLTARLSACATLNDLPARWPVGLCARGVAGRLHGSGSGFPAENAAADLVFWALGAGVQVQHAVSARLLVGAEATLLVPLRRYTFSVGNRGVAYESSAAGAMLQLAAGFELW